MRCMVVGFVFAIPIAIAGCSGGDDAQAQNDAAAKLAADCKRHPEDPATEWVTATGNTVTLNLTEDARAKLRAFAAEKVTTENLEDLVDSDTGFQEGWKVAEGVLADKKCLAAKSGIPADPMGFPKAGDHPNWKVTVDADGIPTLISTSTGEA